MTKEIRIPKLEGFRLCHAGVVIRISPFGFENCGSWKGEKCAAMRQPSQPVRCRTSSLVLPGKQMRQQAIKLNFLNGFECLHASVRRRPRRGSLAGVHKRRRLPIAAG
jgi:hypothetical protein